MNTTTLVALIVGLSLAFAVLLTSGILFFIKKVQKKREEEVRTAFKGKRILRMCPNAVFVGQTSHSAFGAVRGNGVLVLTEDELFFQMWLPKREFRLQVSAITNIQTPKSFQSRTVFRALLQVDYKNESGAPDSIAWAVSELAQWKTALERLR